MASPSPPLRPDAPAGSRPLKKRWLVQLLVMPLLYGAITLLAAGRWDWVWGWLFAAVYLLSNLATLALFRDEELIAERQRSAPDAETWDRWTLKVFGPLYTLVAVVGGLDARYGWTPRWPPAAQLNGGLLVLAAAGLRLWAMRVNTYFSAIVRIQRDRNHRVITTGPYATIRHPGNLSMILWLVGAALLLGSGWALLPAVWRGATTAAVLASSAGGSARPQAANSRASAHIRICPGRPIAKPVQTHSSRKESAPAPTHSAAWVRESRLAGAASPILFMLYLSP